MKLNSYQCKKALKRYRTKNTMEKLAVEVLLSRDEEVVNIPGILQRCNDIIGDLTEAIRKVCNDLGIDGGA